jgi:predicted TIM-barrel fold metal-dependent hydrolase
MPSEFWPNAGAAFMAHPGGSDPEARVNEMTADGVAGEVLYPTLGLKLFSLEDTELQAQCLRRYNEWLVNFCEVAGNRVVGVGLLPTYDIDRAVAELRWCVDHGLRGCEVWLAPPPHLSFDSGHYDPLWEACGDLGAPVSLHIATGFDGFSRELGERLELDPQSLGLDVYRGPSHRKLMMTMNSVFDLMFSGAFDRFPGLKLVLVENEISWLPFIIDQWEYYFNRFVEKIPTALTRQPSEVFAAQIFPTFFRDPVGMRMLGEWGVGNCMWSSDYPHPNSTWPHSREVVQKNLGHLSSEDLEKVVRTTAMELYGLSSGQED